MKKEAKNGQYFFIVLSECVVGVGRKKSRGEDNKGQQRTTEDNRRHQKVGYDDDSFLMNLYVLDPLSDLLCC